MSRDKHCVRMASLVCVAVLATPGLIFAQGGGFRGGFGGGGGVLGLLYRDDVRQDLQLVDEQQEKVDALADEIRTELQDEMREMFRGMQDLSDDERQQQFEKIRTRMEDVNADAEKRLKKVLLPHQFDRLKQIDVQMRMQQQGAGALTSGAIGRNTRSHRGPARTARRASRRSRAGASRENWSAAYRSTQKVARCANG